MSVIIGENGIIQCREDKMMIPLLRGDDKIKLDNFYNFFIKPMMSGFVDMVFDVYKPVLETAINNSSEFIKNTVKIIDEPYEHVILKNNEIASVSDMYDTYGKVFMKYDAHRYNIDDTDEYTELQARVSYLGDFYNEVNDSIWKLDITEILKVYNFDNNKIQLEGPLAVIDMNFNSDQTIAVFWCRPNIEIMIPLIKDTSLRLDSILHSENKILDLKREIAQLSLVK